MALNKLFMAVVYAFEPDKWEHVRVANFPPLPPGFGQFDMK